MVAIAAPWAIETDRTVSPRIVDWLREHWQAHVTGNLRELRFASVSETAIAPSPLHAAPSSRTLRVPAGELHLTACPPHYRLETPLGGCQFELSDQAPAPVAIWGAQPELSLYVGLTEIFRHRGWLSLHASARVAAGASTAVVSLGCSGAGKTYRLLQAIRAGARPLAEDRLWLRAADELCVARDHSLRFLPDTRAAFKDLLNGSFPQEPDGKFRIAFARIPCAPAPPTPLGFFEYLSPRVLAGELRTAESLGARQRVQILWDAVGMPFTADACQTAGVFVQKHINRDWHPAAPDFI